VAIPAQSLTSFPANPSDQISQEAIHPEQLRLECAGELPRGQRRVYDLLFPWLMRKVRQGLPAYLIPSRVWLAQQARVSLSTVTRAFANFSRLGLLDIQERYHKRGNLRRQLTNLIRLPFRRPARHRPEVVKAEQGTKRHRKKTLNKVASGRFFDHKRADPPRGGGFVSAQTILERWAERGLIPQRP